MALPRMAPSARAVADFHRVTGNTGSGEQIAGHDGPTFSIGGNIHTTGQGHFAAATVDAFLMQRQARVDTAGTADDTRHTRVVGLRALRGQATGLRVVDDDDRSGLQRSIGEVEWFGQVCTAGNCQGAHGDIVRHLNGTANQHISGEDSRAGDGEIALCHEVAGELTEAGRSNVNGLRSPSPSTVRRFFRVPSAVPPPTTK